MASSCSVDSSPIPRPSASVARPSASPPAASEFGVSLERVAEGFDLPTAMVEVPGGRFLISELGGTIRYTDDAEVILDLSERIGEIEGEQGLLGIALHPDFPSDPRLFVSYTRADDASVVASYALPPDGSPIRGTASRVIVVPQPDVIHNGGHIAFGPDGYLYLALGDGGPQGDPRADGQNTYTLLGKILRLDVSAAAGYEPPADNPFVAGGGAPEVWAYGFRNPWRFSFDRATGDLWIGDVGEAAWEEINVGPAGAGGLNFGWSRFQGSQCYREADCDPTGIRMPVAEYPHSAPSGVVGGYVYRGSALGELAGQYVYGDLYGKGIWALDPVSPSEEPRLVIDWTDVLVSFAEDRDGEIYLLAFNEGAVYRFVPSPG